MPLVNGVLYGTVIDSSEARIPGEVVIPHRRTPARHADVLQLGSTWISLCNQAAIDPTHTSVSASVDNSAQPGKQSIGRAIRRDQWRMRRLHYEGVEFEQGLEDMFYRARQFGIRDLNGYILYFIQPAQT